MTPLPSFIRASAQDAGNASMRKAGRAQWSDADWNAMCDTQDRLIKSLYGTERDHNDPNRCFFRFQVAERLERQGQFSLRTRPEDIWTAVEAYA